MDGGATGRISFRHQTQKKSGGRGSLQQKISRVTHKTAAYLIQPLTLKWKLKPNDPKISTESQSDLERLSPKHLLVDCVLLIDMRTQDYCQLFQSIIETTTPAEFDSYANRKKSKARKKRQYELLTLLLPIKRGGGLRQLTA